VSSRSKRNDLLESIGRTIRDYRATEIVAPTLDHVDTWIQQFDEEVQLPMLAELNHVLQRTYVSRAEARKFLSSLAKNKDFSGDDPCTFWEGVRFLDIQEEGNSQSEMLAMFDKVLREQCDLQIGECGEKPKVFLYLDDGVFSGNRVRNDLTRWVERDAPRQAEVRVVVMALHLGGEYYAKRGIRTAADNARKEISIAFWRCLSIENRKTYANSSDVFWPTHLPEDGLTKAYANSLKYPPIFRKPGSIGANKFFSSEEGRHLLEQELLKAGAKIRSECPYLNDYQRPLGNMVLDTLGFGTPIVTYRNCPNNCPLAFWVGDPWCPLFPRKTN
jgi:hypothetical protein